MFQHTILQAMSGMARNAQDIQVNLLAKVWRTPVFLNVLLLFHVQLNINCESLFSWTVTRLSVPVEDCHTEVKLSLNDVKICVTTQKLLCSWWWDVGQPASISLNAPYTLSDWLHVNTSLIQLQKIISCRLKAILKADLSCVLFCLYLYVLFVFCHAERPLRRRLDAHDVRNELGRWKWSLSNPAASDDARDDEVTAVQGSALPITERDHNKGMNLRVCSLCWWFAVDK